MRPAYKPPSRFTFPKYVDKEYLRIRQLVDDSIEKADAVSISSGINFLGILVKCQYKLIKIDGWSDVNNNKLIHFVVHTPTPFHFDSIDTGAKENKGQLIKNEFAKQIEKIGPAKVISIVSDHAPNMRLGWTLLQNEYPWLIAEGCKAHALHLLAGDFVNHVAFSSLIAKCSKLVKFLR